MCGVRADSGEDTSVIARPSRDYLEYKFNSLCVSDAVPDVMWLGNIQRIEAFCNRSFMAPLTGQKHYFVLENVDKI